MARMHVGVLPALEGGAWELKERVRAFWETEACGERSAAGEGVRARLERQAAERYAAEPYIHPFARFAEGAGRDVLEVGVGMGADHLEWARSRPRRLAGVDLTARAVEFTQARLALYGLQSDVRQGDAESLPFDDTSFDLTYAWGVLHHTPNIARAVGELHRVLRPGGTARVMLYHAGGLCFRLLWVRHALLAGRPWRSVREVLAEEAESPGTQAFTPDGARALFAGFSQVRVRPVLTMGDLLEGPMGRRHGGTLLRVLKAVWPRPLVRALGDRLGSDLLIEAVK